MSLAPFFLYRWMNGCKQLSYEFMIMAQLHSSLWLPQEVCRLCILSVPQIQQVSSTDHDQVESSARVHLHPKIIKRSKNQGEFQPF